MRMWRVPFLSLLGLFAAGSAGCGSNSAPTLDAISEKRIFVNEAFQLVVTAHDADDDKITYSYSSDISDLKQRDGVQFLQDGVSAIFRWTPKPVDIGLHTFLFTASDGEAQSSIQVSIEVLYQAANAPVFREPLGTGTIVDVAKTSEISIHVVVEDQDSNEVTIDQEDPVIEYATIEQSEPQAADWVWTPSKAQLAADDRYVLTLSADDHSNPKVLKNYLIVLKKPVKTNCSGEAPTIQHAPSDQKTKMMLSVDAVVEDDVGIAHEPLLFYSFEDPGPKPDVTKMVQVTMVPISGDSKKGTWSAEDIPNPVADKPSGSTATLYYVIVVRDNDDAKGDCDHETQAPADASFAMKITNPGGEVGLGPCELCTSDEQCGDAEDNCLALGGSGESYCGKACTGDDQCPSTGYYCSLTEWESVDGKKSKQCLPKSLECTCTDDSFEENDSLTAVLNAPGLQPGSYELVSCPGKSSGIDEDWFVFDVPATSQIKATITGEASAELDLQLVDKDGKMVLESKQSGSNESVSKEMQLGYYFLRVYSSSTQGAKSSYTLTFESTVTAACVDDGNEPDDDRAHARDVTVGITYKVADNQICANNDDWYELMLIKGETVYATAAFDMANNPKKDLDLRFFSETEDLTKCTETDPNGCDPANGQSGTSNENLKKTVPAAGKYYVVVHGWEGSENKYDICISANNQTACPFFSKP